MKPTENELAILNVLWRNGPSTVRTVNTELSKKRKVGYTNTLKMMQIMHEKGMLERDERSRSHVYSPTLDPDVVRRSAIDHMVDTLFEGSAAQLMLQALGNSRPTAEEIEEIRTLLESYDDDCNDV
jgi:predicted transcriptional regulator